MWTFESLGCNFRNLKTPLVRLKGRVTAETYVDIILKPYFLPFPRNNEGGILMYDNAHPHTTHLTIDLGISCY